MTKKSPEIPKFSKPIIETHFHLDMLKDGSQDEFIEKATAQNIEKLITISVEPDNFETVMDMSLRYPNLFGTQGIHPHEAHLWKPEHTQIVKSNALKNKKIVAIGEIGLDYFYDHSPKDVQQIVFEEFLNLADEINLPVVIHTREADEDTINILTKFRNRLNKKGVLHSFTSGEKLLKFALDEGFYIGINGICTFPKAQNVVDLVKLTPIERILLETDAPFLTPIPYRGRENAPHYLPYIALKIAEIKSIPVEEVLEKCYQNSLSLFDFQRSV